MTLDRRAFLRHATLGAVSLTAAPHLEAAGVLPSLPEYSAADPEAFWRGVKALFPLAPGFTYFNTGGLGPTALAVGPRAATDGA